MSSRPKRSTNPPDRYEPVETPLDDNDDYSSEPSNNDGTHKKWKGEFEDDDDEEDGSEPNEYQVGDGFLVGDEEIDIPGGDDEEEEDEFDEETDEDYDEDEDSDEPIHPAKIFESDVACRVSGSDNAE